MPNVIVVIFEREKFCKNVGKTFHLGVVRNSEFGKAELIVHLHSTES